MQLDASNWSFGNIYELFFYYLFLQLLTERLE